MCVFLIAHGRLLKPHEFLYGILASTRCSHYIPVSRMCTPFLEPGFDRDTLLNVSRDDYKESKAYDTIFTTCRPIMDETDQIGLWKKLEQLVENGT